MIKFRTGLVPPVEADLRDAGVVHIDRYLEDESRRFDHPFAEWAAVTLAPGTDDAVAMEWIAAHPSVAAVHHDVWIEVVGVPNDPLFSSQWGLRNAAQTGGTAGADIDAPGAWDLEIGSSAVVIAISDTGIDYGHPDLAASMWRNAAEIPGNGLDDDGNGIVDDEFGANFVPLGSGQPPTGDPLDDALVLPLSHGTLVAGVAAATGNNSVGSSGVAWNVRLMAVKSFGSAGFGTCATVLAGIEYAVLMGAHIVNASWGWPAPAGPGPFAGCEEPLLSAIDFANVNDVLFVVAAGNDGTDNDTVPFSPTGFRMRNLIAVAASDHDDELAAFSNFGANRVQIAAPGVAVLGTMIRCDRYPPSSTIPCDYGLSDGTSFAAPHVAGVAALILSRHPGIAVHSLKTAIVLGADQLPSLQGKVLQGRRLDARGALVASDTWATSSTNAWACDDGIDNDGDGLVDYPDDPGCTSVFPDASESGSCGGRFAAAFMAPLLLPGRAALRRLGSAAGRSYRRSVCAVDSSPKAERRS